jgi:hypothetical protein
MGLGELADLLRRDVKTFHLLDTVVTHAHGIEGRGVHENGMMAPADKDGQSDENKCKGS